MHEVELKPLIHRNTECVGIFFKKNNEIEKIVRRQPGVKWSQMNRCWYLPLNETVYKQLYEILKPHATINNSLLKEYLLQKKSIQLSRPAAPPANTGKKENVKPLPVSPAWQLSNTNLAALERFTEQLKLSAYSSSTIRTYRNEFLQLLRLLKNKNAEELTPDDLRRYMVYAMEKEGIKENTAHSRLNALKFYYEQVLKREKFFWEIPRPKKRIILPKVLGQTEVGRMFKAIENLKHKAILFTSYSAGLRVSEVVNLKVKDIDSSRMLIFIENGKGKKDRYVNLSILLLDILRAYLLSLPARPGLYLFEGNKPGSAYSVRSAQKVFQHALEKAGINKDVGFDSLRHSFATHILERGVDIKYIKDILGHFSIKTTERYLHISKEKLVHILSPLDELWQKGDIEWKS
jgi:integrase/recombinase XerD